MMYISYIYGQAWICTKLEFNDTFMPNVIGTFLLNLKQFNSNTLTKNTVILLWLKICQGSHAGFCTASWSDNLC